VLRVGPLDDRSCKLNSLGGLATTGSQQSFLTRARHLLRDGVEAAAVRLLVIFGASTTFSQTIDRWERIEQLEKEAGLARGLARAARCGDILLFETRFLFGARQGYASLPWRRPVHATPSKLPIWCRLMLPQPDVAD
jgi:hypothetical protein